MAERLCARCGKPIIDPQRRKYCTDACADSATRERIKTRQARGTARVLYRYYPKAEP